MKSVIELVKTAQGYSIIEEGQQINKINNNRGVKQKQFSAAPKKFVQQNFTIYPYLYCHQPEYSQKYIIIPTKSQWFNMNQIHEIQKKALPEWFKTKKAVFGAAKPDKFQKNEQLYKKYRNYIIDLARNEYVSPTAARKGLAGDVCAILRIHSFLQQNGIINYVFSKKPLKNQAKNSQNINRSINSTKKDCVDKDKSIFQKHFDKDHLELFKKITKKIRPICHLCQGICGVLWFQYQQQLYLKYFQQQIQNKNENIMKQNGQQRKQQNRKLQNNNQLKFKRKINSNDRPFKYLLRLCSHCFNTGNLPVVLSHDDFKRFSILDQFIYQYQQPKDKKRISQQNKLIQTLQKNKFSVKKTAQSLKITQKQVISLLLCIPIIKIQKLARIDQQTQSEDNQDLSIKINGVQLHQQPIKQVEDKILDKGQQLIDNFCNQFKSLQQQQEKLYEQFIQLWLLKISTKLGKLSEWEKSTTWFASRLIHDQRNSLAEALKQI